MSTQQDITFYYLEKHIQSLRNAALNAARMAWNPHEYYFGESSPVEAELDPGPLMHYGVSTVRTNSSPLARSARFNAQISGEYHNDDLRRIVAISNNKCLEQH